MDPVSIHFSLSKEVQLLGEASIRLTADVRANHSARLVLDTDKITLRHWRLFRRALKTHTVIQFSEYKKICADIAHLIQSIKNQELQIQTRTVTINKLNSEVEIRKVAIEHLETKLRMAREGARIYQWHQK